MKNPRIIAIDWSGAKTGARRKIWLAEVINGCVTRLEDGRNRAEIEAHLLEHAARDPNIIVGLDFGFSMPAWFMRQQGNASAHELWAHLAADAGEQWLAGCDPPFWGRPGRRRPPDDPARPTHRRCEDGTGAKSVFQVGGAGAVGTGSLRGMPMLHRLHAGGCHIWPYDDPGWPLVVEIYPRMLTGPVKKSNAAERECYVTTHATGIDERFVRAACASDDAFDALFSATGMWKHIDQIRSLAPVDDPMTRIEGAIWHPDWDASCVGGSGTAVGA